MSKEALVGFIATGSGTESLRGAGEKKKKKEKENEKEKENLSVLLNFLPFYNGVFMGMSNAS